MTIFNTTTVAGQTNVYNIAFDSGDYWIVNFNQDYQNQPLFSHVGNIQVYSSSGQQIDQHNIIVKDSTHYYVGGNNGGVLDNVGQLIFDNGSLTYDTTVIVPQLQSLIGQSDILIYDPVLQLAYGNVGLGYIAFRADKERCTLYNSESDLQNSVAEYSFNKAQASDYAVADTDFTKDSNDNVIATIYTLYDNNRILNNCVITRDVNNNFTFSRPSQLNSSYTANTLLRDNNGQRISFDFNEANKTLRFGNYDANWSVDYTFVRQVALNIPVGDNMGFNSYWPTTKYVFLNPNDNSLISVLAQLNNQNFVIGSLPAQPAPQPNPNPQPTPQPTPTPVDSNINTGMGETFYELDLQTNLKKYFGEAFKFDGTQFEMDGDRIVGIKQSFIDSIAVDLTNIVNTSIRTATLTADNATINETLTALGIVSDAVETKKLVLADAQGGKHELHLGN